MNFFAFHTLTGQPVLAGLTANPCIILLWIWLFHPVYAYLGTIFTARNSVQPDRPLGGYCIDFHEMRRGQFSGCARRTAGASPAWSGRCLTGAAPSSRLSAVRHQHPLGYLVRIGTYGLLGLWMEGRAWWQGLTGRLCYWWRSPL